MLTWTSGSQPWHYIRITWGSFALLDAGIHGGAIESESWGGALSLEWLNHSTATASLLPLFPNPPKSRVELQGGKAIQVCRQNLEPLVLTNQGLPPGL